MICLLGRGWLVALVAGSGGGLGDLVTKEFLGLWGHTMVPLVVVLLSPNVHALGALHQQAFPPLTVDND